MKQTMKNIKSNKGFTLIEVISVLILIGIISVVMIARMSNTADYDLASQLEAVKAHLRLAQSRAMSWNKSCGVNFSAQTTYYLFDASAPDTPVQMLGEKNVTVDLVDKDSTLKITSAPQVVTFDAYGSPGTATVTVATNGGNITITKNTGFIP
jgi:MSHA pilin protein MshC